jgi:cytochrome P450
LGAYLNDNWIVPKEVKFIDDFQDAFAGKAFARADKAPAAGQLNLIDDLIQKGKDRAAIKNAATSVLLAGKDPGVTTITAAFYEIARHPEVFAKIKAEVEEQ